ncbi:hypothetical protein F511_15398 [Dorcoceras hygrometricum]|uniref:Uncharacterized protein n=1 Tax=Dorcoceras hygrometricum TaxID=472368 RepID=A0A2Z7C9X2_9LAMI|nr:hypothetical protein F511_15398 [Dorcoceras hygrometricum]
MPPKKRSKIPKYSRSSSTKSLELFSQIPNPSPVASPANPFLLPCISNRCLVRRAPNSPPRRNPHTFIPPYVESFSLRPPLATLQGFSFGFAGFSSSPNPFGVLRFPAMSSSEQCVAPSAVDIRFEVGASLPVEVIGPIYHPSYSNNAFPSAIQNLLFPVHSRSTSDLLLSQPLLPHAVSAQFKSWP